MTDGKMAPRNKLFVDRYARRELPILPAAMGCIVPWTDNIPVPVIDRSRGRAMVQAGTANEVAE